MTKFGISIAIYFLCFTITRPAYAQKEPDFNEIVAKFIEKSEADSLYIGDNYIHRERLITKTLKNGVISEIKEERFWVEKKNGELYKKLTEKDGLTVTNSRFKKKDEIISIGVELLERYDFVFARNENLEGTRCWVFNFRPKASPTYGRPREKLSELNDKDGAFNRMAGEIWISQNGLSFKKIAGHLLSEASISKIIGSARLFKLNFVATAKLIEGRFAVDYIWAEYIYTAKLFGFVTVISNRHEIREIFYEDYESR